MRKKKTILLASGAVIFLAIILFFFFQRQMERPASAPISTQSTLPTPAAPPSTSEPSLPSSLPTDLTQGLPPTQPGIPTSIPSPSPAPTAAPNEEQPEAKDLKATTPSKKTPRAVEVTQGDRCWLSEFEHGAILLQSADESNIHFKNQINLTSEHGPINPSSLCVRTDGKPLSFKLGSKKGQKNSLTLLLGPIQKLSAKISVLYCTGTVRCSTSCDIKKDGFLSAIGGGDSQSDGLSPLAGQKSASHWKSDSDGSSDDGKDHAELEDQLVQMDDDLTKNADIQSVFNKWIEKSNKESCKTGLTNRR